MSTLQPMPRAADEAQVLITICDDDIAQARIEALHNYRGAQTDDEAVFWAFVVEMLTPSARPQG